MPASTTRQLGNEFMGRDNETWYDSAYRDDYDEHDSGTFVRNLVFVGMAFDLPSEISDTYQAIKRACSNLGLNAMRVDDESDSGPIPVKILRGIEEAEFLVFDLSVERPNVYYELGYAHGAGNRANDIAIVAKTGTKVHFDVAQLAILFYESAIDLEQKLSKRLAKMIEATR
jgi:hypothetical protein